MSYPHEANPVVAEFTDRYGETRRIHKTRHGLRVKQEKPTPILALNQAIGALIGTRIRYWRTSRGLSQRELAALIGIEGGDPKQRIHELETSHRRQAMRLGTLYALAIALDVTPSDLLPTKEEVAELAGVRGVTVQRLSVTP